ncbi:MAG: hypothetical protein ABI910_05595 [Gemmatimonadota bacterium]
MNAPPLRLPGEHFAAALVFLLAGAFGLAAVAAGLSSGSYPAPAMVAVTHLFTLGWLTTSIMGALYQFLPVALGQPIASERAAHLTFALHVTGVVLLVTGMYLAQSALRLGGITVLGVGIVVFLANLGTTLRRAERRDVTWWAICAAAVFLGITFVFGAALGVNLRSGFLGGAQRIALGTHIHVALVGWILLVIVGVSHRLLPMFLLSHGGRTHFARYAVALLAAGAGMLALFHHVPVVGRELPALCIAAGVVAYLLQAREFYRHRHRPALDPGLRLAAVALGLLAVALPLGAIVLLGAATPRVQTAYVLVVLLACTLFVAAHYYKIVPFLVWNRHFGPLVGTRTLPRVGELYAPRLATVAVACLTLGAVALAATVGTGTLQGVRASSLVFAAGVVIESGQMLAIARRRP